MTNVKTKVCNSCKTDFPLHIFRKRGKDKKYYYPYCPDCLRKYSNKLYHAKQNFVSVPSLDGEQWRPVVGYDDLYEVSNLARIKRLSAPVPHPVCGYIRRKERIVKQHKKKDGYWKAILSKNGIHETPSVHLVVWDAWGDESRHKPGYVIDHDDNNKDNNGISNLKLITQRLNASKDRRRKHSKYLGASKHSSNAKCWEANIFMDGKKKRLGLFYTEEEAAAAYQSALQKFENKAA